MKKFTHSIAFKIIIGIVAVLAVYGVIMLVSVQNVRTRMNDAKAQASTIETTVNDGKYDEASTALRQLSNDIAEVQRELSGWQWNVASVVPMAGDDVRCAQQLASIGDDLANKAGLPVLDSVEKVGGLVSDGSTNITDLDPSNFDFTKLFSEETLNTLSEFAKTITNARDVIGDCKSRVDAVPEPHSAQLQKARTQLIDAVTKADDMLGKFDGLLQLLKQLP